MTLVPFANVTTFNPEYASYTSNVATTVQFIMVGADVGALVGAMVGAMVGCEV